MKFFWVIFTMLAGHLIAEESRAEVATKPFDKPEKWEAADPEAWEWREKDGVKVLSLLKQSDYKPKVRSPFNLIWFRDAEWESFDLRLEMRLTTFNKRNNDLCIAFSGEDDSLFYYAHLGQKADMPHHQIHLVDNADRKPITTWRTKGTAWEKETWHKVRVLRDAVSGEITVFFDGEKLLIAKDKTFSKGMIGLGSFDDTGDFRNLEIRRVKNSSR